MLAPLARRQAGRLGVALRAGLAATTVRRPDMDWDSPEQRYALINRVGINEYNRLILRHFEDSRVATVNGYGIRPVGSRFGRIFMVEGTNKGYSTLEAAKEYAASLPESRP
jgi:hypothetical protein